MPKSIAVLGAGLGLGRAVARRYAQEGYEVVLVARRRQPLDLFAQDLTSAGANAHVITADLANTDAVPALAEQIRAAVGDLDALYYAPTPAAAFVPAAELTPQRAQDLMPLAVYSLLAAVQQFLPHMLEQGAGAILTAQGASAVQGVPNMSGPGPAQAAQRNYLQSLHAEVAKKGVYVGMLYIGAIIENSAFHIKTEEARNAGASTDWGPAVNPAHLADLLWNMHAPRARRKPSIPNAASTLTTRERSERAPTKSRRGDEFALQPSVTLRGEDPDRLCGLRLAAGVPGGLAGQPDRLVEQIIADPRRVGPRVRRDDRMEARGLARWASAVVFRHKGIRIHGASNRLTVDRVSRRDLRRSDAVLDPLHRGQHQVEAAVRISAAAMGHRGEQEHARELLRRAQPAHAVDERVVVVDRAERRDRLVGPAL
ncbi:MAG: SDR family NAD(P)-dependent oxidoreductase, partial [Solirubrobacterales bacterium]|nr:SDR family NAD(P)-dependent oxidoreductase [Solirubrobacterales bacterium]